MSTRIIEPSRNLAPRLHRDRTASYWSFSEARWVERAIYVPDHEMERMGPRDQKRVRRHLGLETATA